MSFKRYSFIFVILLLSFSVLLFFGCGTVVNESAATTTTTTMNKVDQALDNMTFSSFESFPVDLDLYFTNNASSSLPIITPFMTHLGSNHPEGPAKWYVYPHGVTYEVVSPGPALIKTSEAPDMTAETTATIGDYEVYVDAEPTLWFDKNKKMPLGHMRVLKSLADRALASSEGYILVSVGEHIGYTMTSTALDVLMIDSQVDNDVSEDYSLFSNRVCPLNYLDTDLRAKLVNYYDTYVYAKMVTAGTYPESRIDSPINKNVDNTIWGTWWYKSGLSPSSGFWYYFSYGFLVFLQKEKTNSETFFKNPQNGNLISQECSDWIGMYVDYDGISSPVASDGRFVVLESGTTSTEGILALKAFSDVSSIKYLRFVLDLGTDSKFDDELSVKFYDALSAAQSDSFSDPIVYTKDESKGTALPDQ